MSSVVFLRTNWGDFYYLKNKISVAKLRNTDAQIKLVKIDNQN